jgi:hypothetical protein
MPIVIIHAPSSAFIAKFMTAIPVSPTKELYTHPLLAGL